jgi:hypothetical protein
MDRGHSWQTAYTGEAVNASAVWSVDQAHVVLATQDGSLFLSEDSGGSWARVHQQPDATLYGLWGGADGDVYAAGGSGASAAGDGGVSPGSGGEQSCDGSSPAEVAAGAVPAGVLLHSADHGRTWATVATSPTGVFWNVWGTPDARVVAAAGPAASVAVTYDHGKTWVVNGRAGWPTQFDLDDVWVGPGDGTLFFASATGVVRGIAFQCAGPVNFSTEVVPTGSDGMRGTVGIWGWSSGDVWAVGRDGSIYRRQ